jgi:hypothetical protein
MINFIKKNWSIIILAIIALVWIKNNFLSNSLSLTKRSSVYNSAPMDYMGTVSEMALPASTVNYSKNMAPPSESSDRIVIQDSGLSLQVEDVQKTIDEIEKTTKEFGGFLITYRLSKPEGVASGSISIRVPEDKRKEAMTAYKSMAVKVVSESVNGNDVTNEYVDLEARLEVLNKTKIKYEEILQKAEKVTDLMSVQQQLTSLQSQIDNLKGQQKYYEQSAKLSKITIYLSTDELALPYAPTNEWRPTVIFKEAVRSLVGAVRGIGSLTIWIVVFLPIIIPVVLIIRFIRKRKNKTV